MGIRQLLTAPLRLAQQSVVDLDALVRATRNLPGFERALHTQLSGLIALVSELSLQVQKLPAPLLAIAEELPPVGLQVGGLQRDVAQIRGVVEDVSSAIATIDPRLLALEGVVERLSRQLVDLQTTLGGLSTTVKDAAVLLPNPDDSGLLGPARDALTGTGAPS